ncbi:MAG: UDP-3-O-acyl-N-acetylglucosamine deacetylase [Bacteriovoracia bacterium]
MSTQKTLKRDVSFRGVGLHSGKKVVCRIHPAPAGFGIVFLRSDVNGKPRIRADISRVSRTDMSTSLSTEAGSSEVSVATVEHLMAAIVGAGIDNALIEINAPEIPIMDGSAAVFFDGITDAGIVSQNALKKALILKKPLSVQGIDKFIKAKPAQEFKIRGKIQFKHECIGEQFFEFGSGRSFRMEVAAARTFGFLREVEYLHKKGLALGASLDNAVVLTEDKILNPEGLRYKNEFVRHKVLDAIGDFALLGMQLIADVEVHKSGHELHAGFLKKILENPENYEIVELGSLEAQTASEGSGSSNEGISEEQTVTPLFVTAY